MPFLAKMCNCAIVHCKTAKLNRVTTASTDALACKTFTCGKCWSAVRCFLKMRYWIITLFEGLSFMQWWHSSNIKRPNWSILLIGFSSDLFCKKHVRKITTLKQPRIKKGLNLKFPKRNYFANNFVQQPSFINEIYSTV